jgi:hypothetical protein
LKLPKVLRSARSRVYAYQNPQNELNTFNRGYQGPDQTIDALRGGGRLVGDQTANLDAIEQAARNSSTRHR